jgi:hypothetical protein
MKSRDVYVGVILFILGLAFFFVVVSLLFNEEQETVVPPQVVDSTY